MNRQEFEAEIRSALGGRISGDETTQLQVGGADYELPRQWITRGERMIARKHHFTDMITTDTSLATVTDTQTVAIPTSTNRTRSMRLIDGTQSRVLDFKPIEWVDRKYPNPTDDASNKPCIYTIRGSNYEFIPVPDAAYTLYVDVWKWPVAITGDSAVSDFGEGLVDDVILHYAIALGFSHYAGKYKEDAGFHWGLGNSFLLDAIASDNYYPDYRTTPEGYSMSQKGLANALDPGSVPSGVVNPWGR